METHPLTAKNWSIVAGIAVVLGALFISPYLGVVALAALMAFLFYGVYDRLNRKMRSGAAATWTFLYSLLIVLVPLIIIGIFTINQLAHFAASVTNLFGGDFSTLPASLAAVVERINAAVAALTGNTQFITGQGLTEFIQGIIPALISGITAFLASFIGGIPFAIIIILMYIFLFYECLVYGKKMVSGIVALSPFQPEITRMYLARVGMMANAMAKGEIIMAFGIGALEAATIGLFFGIMDYFFLMAVAFGLFNLIPLGAGIIAYPLIFIGMLLGNVWEGIGALIVVTAVANLESFLRPKFIPKSITLTNGLTLLAAFAGINLFGIIGVVYGPIIMIIIVTSIQMYLDYYQEMPSWKKRANKTAK